MEKSATTLIKADKGAFPMNESLILNVECLVCGEVTALNLLPDGTTVCSCPSHRKFKKNKVEDLEKWFPID